MPRIYLAVPFIERDVAKALGARWDAEARVWYVPDGLDLKPFGTWLPAAPGDDGPNVRAPRYYIAEAERDCWKCRARAPTFAFVLPLGHEVAWVDDSLLDGRWVPMNDIEATLAGVDLLCSAAVGAIVSITRTYRPSSRHGGQWVNHCFHCDAVFGDFYDHDEPDGAFCPMTPEAAARITLREYCARFEARAGYGDCLFFESMHVHGGITERLVSGADLAYKLRRRIE